MGALIVPTMAIYALLSRLFRRTIGGAHLPKYYAGVGVLFVLFLHGPGALFMLAIMLGNYAFAKLAHRRIPYALYMLLMWSAHIAILVLNFTYEGYRFGDISARLSWLDGDGILRWHILFNFSTLRMIAFNYDLWESAACGAETRERVEKKHHGVCLECVMYNAPCYRLRTDSPRPVSEFTLTNYLAYTLYVPLYIAGPPVVVQRFHGAHAPPPAMLRRAGRCHLHCSHNPDVRARVIHSPVLLRQHTA